MSPERAWSAILQELSLEMSHKLFVVGLKESRYLGLQDGIFTIGVPDAYTRDWLASRLQRTIEHKLIGYLAQKTEVRFVQIDPEPPVEEAQPDPRDQPNSLGQSEEHLEPIETIRPFQADLHKILTRPHARTVLPAYFIRWLPFLGPDGGWFIVAMHQAFYFAENARLSAENAGTTFTVNRNWLSTWSGLGKQKVIKLLQLTAEPAPGNYVSWFIRGSDPQKGQAREYCFRYDMPLTPADAERLSTWLQDNGIAETPLDTLQKLVDMPIKEVLPYPVDPPSTRQDTTEAQPQNTVELVEGLLPPGMPGGECLRALALARQLHNNIVHPSDNLHITHYFLRNWVGVLKPGPAWVVTLLRDKGFQDSTRGILRDRIRLKDGYRELATTLGVRPRSISEWLPPLEEMIRSDSKGAHISTQYKHAKTAAMRRFVLEKDGRLDHSGRQETEYTFRIRLDDPLLPEHEAVYLDVSALVMLAVEGIPGPKGALETRPEDWKFEVATENGQPLNGLTQKTDKLPTGWYRIRASLEVVATENGQGLPRNARDIKDLIIKFFNQKVLSEIQLLLRGQCTEQADQSENTEMGGWSEKIITTLLAIEGISLSKIAEIRTTFSEDPEAKRRLVAWLLYGFANLSSSSRPGIDNPGLYALSRYQKSPPRQHYRTIAKSSPDELLQRIRNPHGFFTDGLSWDHRVLNKLKVNGFEAVLESVLEAQS